MQIISTRDAKGQVMDDEALAFLEKWIEDNAVAVTAHLRAEKAEALAERCLRDAAEADISEEAIEEAAAELSDGGDLAGYIEAALESASNDDDDGDDEDEDEDA